MFKWWSNFWQAYHISYETAKSNAEHGMGAREAAKSGVDRAKRIMEKGGDAK